MPTAEKVSCDVEETDELSPLLVHEKVQDGKHVAPHVTLSGSPSTRLIDGDTPLGERVRACGESAHTGPENSDWFVGHLQYGMRKR